MLFQNVSETAEEMFGHVSSKSSPSKLHLPFQVRYGVDLTIDTIGQLATPTWPTPTAGLTC